MQGEFLGVGSGNYESWTDRREPRDHGGSKLLVAVFTDQLSNFLQINMRGKEGDYRGFSEKKTCERKCFLWLICSAVSWRVCPSAGNLFL